MITLTEEQKRVHDYICDFVLTKKGKLLTFGGVAGVGKTTTVAEIARTLKKSNKRLAFCAISGKASSVLRSKLTEILTPDDYCGTIHSLIYRLIGSEKLKSGRTELYFEADSGRELQYDVIFLDEASMCDEWTFKDLSNYGVKIVAIGDHKQLPPVRGKFNLMADPELKLETIMRQAEGNPIIKLSIMARNGDPIPYGDYGQGCIKTKELKVLHDHNFRDLNSIMLCALNRTRVRMNNFAREKIGNVVSYPVEGEPVICLFNNHKRMIFNGNIGMVNQISELDDVSYAVNIDFDDFTYSGEISKSQFGQEYTNISEDQDFDYFDWAFCISVWKAQGSEFRNVLLLEEGEFFIKENWPRFLYTAITRAKERIVIYKR